MVYSPLNLAMLQFCAGNEPQANLERIAMLCRHLSQPVDLIVLPECAFIRGTREAMRAQAQIMTPDNPVLRFFGTTARRFRAWLLAGSMIEKTKDGHFYNTALLFSPSGNLHVRYRKTHLFRVNLGSGKLVDERHLYEAGNQLVMTEIRGWQTGLAMCYDLRFPEVFRAFRRAGAHLFLVISNFTQGNSPEHWEMLNRVRALENQCFLVNVNQVGGGVGESFPSCGESMVVGPWGEVICRAPYSAEGLWYATLDPRQLQRTRERIAPLTHIPYPPPRLVRVPPDVKNR
ncbi:MAG: hypothetical protein D6820_10095 [Lentisphaerae bacterium]|nr:MAG: hypothetical protein D6820_10095 [Lentisphaerota bacterium]